MGVYSRRCEKHASRRTRGPFECRLALEITPTRVAHLFLLCVTVAGVYGALTVNRRILYIQAAPALVALLLLWLKL